MSRRYNYRYWAKRILKASETIFDHYERECKAVLAELDPYVRKSGRICNEYLSGELSKQACRRKLHTCGKDLITKKFLTEKYSPFRRGYALSASLINIFPKYMLISDLPYHYFADPVVNKLRKSKKYVEDLGKSVTVMEYITRFLLGFPYHVENALKSLESGKETYHLDFNLASLHVFSGYEKPPWKLSEEEKEVVRKYLELYREEVEKRVTDVNIEEEWVKRVRSAHLRKIGKTLVYFISPVNVPKSPRKAKEAIEELTGFMIDENEPDIVILEYFPDRDSSPIKCEGPEGSAYGFFYSLYPFVDFRDYVKRKGRRRKSEKDSGFIRMIEYLHVDKLSMRSFYETDEFFDRILKDYYFHQDEVQSYLRKIEIEKMSEGELTAFLPAFITNGIRDVLCSTKYSLKKFQKPPF